jgi:hypothetical protein
MAYYLRIGDDFLNDAKRYATKADAVAAYREMAEEFDRYGSTPPEAAIHIAARKSELAEYSDFALSVGPRGGIRCERC